MNNPPKAASNQPSRSGQAPASSIPANQHLNTDIPRGNFHRHAHRSATNFATGIPYSPEEAARIQASLNKVLGPEYVSFRPGGGGQNVSYIEGWKALNLANEVFGFNGWSSELISVQVDYLDSHGSGRVSLGLSVVVRITIRDGTFHEDFGYGNIDNAKNKAVAFEKCKKEAFTDAVKRCLRCFGNLLGNCLYDKGIVAKMQKVKLPPPDLTWDDYHRDPLVVRRDISMQRRAAAISNSSGSAPTHTGSFVPNTGPTTTSDVKPPGATPAFTNRTERHTPPGAEQQALTPTVVRDHDLGDFDDSFVFSDDLPGEEDLNDRLDEYELELLGHSADSKSESKTIEDASPATEKSMSMEDRKTPGQVFFTSSKKALSVQSTSNQENIPVFDHKFVAQGVKRTVDPSKSAKVRRQDVPTPHTASQMNSSRAASPNLANTSIGKRPLGMPPSQRPPSKRLHKTVGDPVDKENTES